ncbi:MAG: M23 family metallopeptidase [Lachnospiraceae bacterium]|nr:M23 family metallopeptidase [Lachnospiraceae bacterium]
MKSRQRTLRMIFSGALFVATLACGVYAYKEETHKQEELRQETARQEEELKDLTDELAEDANTSNAKADLPEETPVTTKAVEQTDGTTTGETDGTTAETPESTVTGQPEGAAVSETPGAATSAPENTETPADEDADTTTSDAILPALDFNEGTTLVTPIVGQTLIPYSMDATVYFPTLDQYRYNPAVIITAETHAPVVAVANSQVVSITEEAVTGTTVTMDMGNGFQAVYGQLADLTVTPGQIVESGTVIGKVNDPTKYYTKEGANLYFSITKDGTPLDPALYLPPVEE